MDLDRIPVPAWARAKAIKGLTLSYDAVWLGRIAAKALATMDREAGGIPVVTSTEYRPCPVCTRPLLGAEAVARWQLDRSFTGTQVPCGPDCLEVARHLRRK